jgi:hypothetical protein
MYRLLAATSLHLLTMAAQAADVWAPPADWDHATNPVVVAGKPLWRLDQIMPSGELDELEEPGNYRPFAWDGERWFNAEGSLDKLPWATTGQGTITFGVRGRHTATQYWINRDSEYSFRFAALAFIAPRDGRYTVAANVDIHRERGDSQFSLSLYTRETCRDGVPFVHHLKNGSPACNWWGKIELSADKANAIASREIVLHEGNELLLVPVIEGDNPVGTATLSQVQITGAPWKDAPIAKPAAAATTLITPNHKANDTVFPACHETIDSTMEFWGGYRGLHAGHQCSQVIDITQAPYLADNTGHNDVSKIITKALTENRNTNRIIYLPNGTYLVTDSITMREDGGNIGPSLQGQSRQGTIIRLRDGTWPRVDGAHSVLKTGAGKPENFQRIVRSLTISIGKNNDGASGVFFFGNNQSSMGDIDIRSEDGKGQIGLDLEAGGGDQGPCLVRDTSVTGFDVGVRASAISSVTIHHLTLSGQRKVGVLHHDYGFFIDGLQSNNHVPAVSCGNGLLLVNAVLTGGDPNVPAITHSGGLLFLRNVTTAGYHHALVTPSVDGITVPTTATITEFTAHPAARCSARPVPRWIYQAKRSLSQPGNLIRRNGSASKRTALRV